MRKLSDKEREYFLEWANEGVRISKFVGKIFYGFGGFQIGAILLGILFGWIQGIDILFAIVGAGMLAAFYFGIPTLIINQNTFKKMAQIVEAEKEIVYDGSLTGFTHRRHNDNSPIKGKVYCKFDDDTKICNIPRSLVSDLNIGTPVAVLSFNIAAKGELFAIRADYDAIEREE